MRNTIQRTLICQTVTRMHNHPSADMVYERLHRDYPGIGRATVYRVLQSLAQQGLVRKVCLPSADRYDFTLYPHAHIFCRVCGRVEDMPDPDDRRTPTFPTEQNGFTVEARDVIYRGICADCKSNVL